MLYTLSKLQNYSFSMFPTSQVLAIGHRVESFSESLLVVALVAFLHASVHKAPNIQDRLDPCHRPQGFCPYSRRHLWGRFVIVGFWAYVIFLFGVFFLFGLLGMIFLGLITKAWLKNSWKMLERVSGIEFQTEVARRGNFTCYDTGGGVDTSSIINSIPLVSPIVVYLGIILDLCLVPWLIYVWYQ